MRAQIISKINKNPPLNNKWFFKLPRWMQVDVISCTDGCNLDLSKINIKTLLKIYKTLNNEPKRTNKKNCQGGKQEAESRLLESEAI